MPNDRYHICGALVYEHRDEPWMTAGQDYVYTDISNREIETCQQCGEHVGRETVLSKEEYRIARGDDQVPEELAELYEHQLDLKEARIKAQEAGEEERVAALDADLWQIEHEIAALKR